jgi:hypothetical protein
LKQNLKILHRSTGAFKEEHMFKKEFKKEKYFELDVNRYLVRFLARFGLNRLLENLKFCAQDCSNGI